MPWVNEGCFALLGMAGLISGMLQAPLTGIFLIIEITGSYEVILPLIIVSAISTSLCHYIEPASFYLKDLMDRGQLLRPGTDARVLSDLRTGELLETDCIIVNETMTLRDLIKIVKVSHRNHYPVEESDSDRFLGMIKEEVDRNVNHWHFFEGGKFEENLYDTPHDSLVVTGAFGHGLIRDIVFGSKMEKSNPPYQTTC